jgi:hypothetical protein
VAAADLTRVSLTGRALGEAEAGYRAAETATGNRGGPGEARPGARGVVSVAGVI